MKKIPRKNVNDLEPSFGLVSRARISTETADKYPEQLMKIEKIRNKHSENIEAKETVEDLADIEGCLFKCEKALKRWLNETIRFGGVLER